MMLTKVGQEILAYLKSIFPQGSQIKICVDPYTFRKCVEQAGYSYETVFSKLKQGAKCQRNDGYKALAIVAFQTKLTYEIASNCNVSNAYWDKLYRIGIGNPDDYFSGGEKGIGYTAQDMTWDIAKDFLEKNGLFLDLGDVYKHDGAYRYVQYPRSQQIISKNDLLNFIDDFEKVGLLPGCDIEYKDFMRLLGKKSDVLSDKAYHSHIECHTSEALNILGHLVYGFYKNWDGSPRLAFERAGGGGGNGTALDNYFFSAYPFDEECSSVIKASLKKGIVPLKNVPEIVVAGSQYEKNPYFTLVYGYSSEWCFAKGNPRLGQSILMIYKQSDWNRLFALKINPMDDFFVRSWGEYYVVAVKSLTNKVANILRLKTQLAVPVEYIGGLRSRYAYVQGWLDFAMPRIKLSSEYSCGPVVITNKKRTVSINVDIHDSIIDLDKITLAPDQYFLISGGRRVPDSDFEIASITKEMKKEAICGWEVSTAGTVFPCRDCSKINVVGFDFSCEADADSNERAFLRKAHKFDEKRVFNKNYLRQSKKLV